VIAYITVRVRGLLATTDHDVRCGLSKSDNQMHIHVRVSYNRAKNYLFHIYKAESNRKIYIDMHMQNAYSSGTVAHAIFSNRTWKMQTASEPCHQAKWTLPPDDAFSPAQHFSLLCITFLCREAAAPAVERPRGARSQSKESPPPSSEVAGAQREGVTAAVNLRKLSVGSPPQLLCPACAAAPPHSSTPTLAPASLFP
jgi:hypothetical protein